MSYEDLRKTDLFEFFNFSESGRRRVRGDMQEIHLKPGGFQEFIDVILADAKRRDCDGCRPELPGPRQVGSRELQEAGRVERRLL